MKLYVYGLKSGGWTGSQYLRGKRHNIFRAASLFDLERDVRSLLTLYDWDAIEYQGREDIHAKELLDSLWASYEGRSVGNGA